MEGFSVSVGLSVSGVLWGSDPQEETVHIVTLVLGDERRADEHIRILGQIATFFSQGGVVERLLECRDSASLYQQLVELSDERSGASGDRVDTQTLAMLQYASQLADTLSAGSVIVLGPRHLGRYLHRLARSPNRPWVLAGPVIQEGAEESQAFDAWIRIPSRGLLGRQRVDAVILIGLLEGVIQLEDLAICVYARATMHTLDTVHVVDLQHQFSELLMVSREIRRGDIKPEVLYRTLQLANEMAVEGREGNPVGTLYVLGDYEQVAKHTQQIVMNPFRGYTADERNILDPSLTETLKEFALLDGAFVIRGDGEVMSAGSCVQVHAPIEVAPGLGTRHAAGQAISAVTSALAVVVSQSTGTVSVYRSGRRILALTKRDE